MVDILSVFVILNTLLIILVCYFGMKKINKEIEIEEKYFENSRWKEDKNERF